MNKKEFIKLIQDNIDKFVCITIFDASLSSAHTTFSGVHIVWKNSFNKTVLVELRCKKNDPRILKEKEKYTRWSKEIKRT